jgi:hypothetical protein
MKLVLLVLAIVHCCCAQVVLPGVKLSPRSEYGYMMDEQESPSKCSVICNKGCTFYVELFQITKTKHALKGSTYQVTFNTYACSLGYGPISPSSKSVINTKAISTIIGQKSVKIKQTNFDKYLDSNEYGQVYTEPSNFKDNQIWTIFDNKDGTICLRNSKTHLYLDSDGTKIYTHTPNGGDYQKWIFKDNQLIHFKSSNYLGAENNKVVFSLGSFQRETHFTFED